MNASSISAGLSLATGVPLQPASINPAADPAASNPADLASQELMEWLGVDKALKKGGKPDPIANRNGAPRLEMPVMNFSPSDLQDLLRNLHSKAFALQMDTSIKNVEIQRTTARNNTDQQLSKIQEWIKKSEEKENLSLGQKILNWFAKVFAVIASVAAVVVTAAATAASGGAASVLLALSVMAAVSAVMALADAISQEEGGPPISVQSLVNAIAVPMLKAFGVDEKEAQQISKAMAGAMAVLVPALLVIEPQLLGGAVEALMALGEVEEGIAAIFGYVATMLTAVAGGTALAVMSGGSSVATGVSKTITTLNKVTHSVDAAISSASTIAQGAVGVAKGHLTMEADKLISDRKELQAFMVRIQTLLDQATDDVKKVIEAIEHANAKVSAIVSGAAETALQVARGVGGRRNTA